MKIFASELANNYDTYTFGYCIYCTVEEADSLSSLYAQGFLPYSGSPEVENIFYMARSARVVLPHFELTSENRRIAKKFDGMFEKTVQAGSPGVDALEFCLEYFSKRHGIKAMPKERLEYIFRHVTSTMIYHSAGKPVAYVVTIGDAKFEHYWYSFYDLELSKQSLGLWLMLDCVRDAKARGLTYYYLGTVYGAKALYKTNFEPLEWWDGKAWNTDIKLLRERGRSDHERTLALADLWKQSQKLF